MHKKPVIFQTPPPKKKFNESERCLLWEQDIQYYMIENVILLYIPWLFLASRKVFRENASSNPISLE